MPIQFSDFLERLVLIGGPCVIESEEHVRFMAGAIRDSLPAGTPFVFKASFDKANRTSASAYRGPGMVEGLRRNVRVADNKLMHVHVERTGEGPAATMGTVLKQLPNDFTLGSPGGRPFAPQCRL